MCNKKLRIYNLFSFKKVRLQTYLNIAYFVKTEKILLKIWQIKIKVSRNSTVVL